MIDYPKTPQENIEFRANLYEKAKKDIDIRSCLYGECRDNIEFFFDVFCWTYDPRLLEPEIPFILYPRQRRFLAFLDDVYTRSKAGEKINVVVDKPRDVGATFTFMGWVLHKYLFGKFNARVGSRKEDYVDKKGEPDSLFYKLDYMLERLPSWMRGENDRTHMMLGKKGSENQVSGESANPDFSRGGRKSVILFDEIAFWEWAQSSWESSGESTNLRVALSTPPKTGKDSFFYKLLTGTKGKVEKFSFDWTDVPKKDEGWLKVAKETKSDEEFAREVLKSFEGTTEGKVYALTLRLATISDEYDYDPTMPLFVSWDFGLDQVAMIWLQKDIKTNRVRIIDTYHNSDKEIDFFVPFVTGQIESGIHEYTQYELDIIKRHSQWSKTVTHMGDPDVKKRNLVKKTSVKQTLESKGIYVQSKPWGGREWKDFRDKTQMLIRRLDIHETRNEYFLSAMRSARYPERTEKSKATMPITKPIHDWTSHFRTSLEYFADNEPDLANKVDVRQIRAIDRQLNESYMPGTRKRKGRIV